MWATELARRYGDQGIVSTSLNPGTSFFILLSHHPLTATVHRQPQNWPAATSWVYSKASDRTASSALLPKDFRSLFFSSLAIGSDAISCPTRSSHSALCWDVTRRERLQWQGTICCSRSSISNNVLDCLYNVVSHPLGQNWWGPSRHTRPKNSPRALDVAGGADPGCLMCDCGRSNGPVDFCSWLLVFGRGGRSCIWVWNLYCMFILIFSVFAPCLPLITKSLVCSLNLTVD